MTPFYQFFPDLADTETKVITVQDIVFLPAGEYGFIDFYCDQVDCDCRRVYILVLSPATGSKVWATINYGWEDLKFYQGWLVNEQHALTCKGPSLLPFTEQTPFAPALLQLFEFLISDPAYIQCLKKHYELFKTALRDNHKLEMRRKGKQKKLRRRLK
jgi:hypothetical protein